MRRSLFPAYKLPRMGSKKVVGHSAGALGSEKTAQFKSLQTMAVGWAKVGES